MKIFTYWEPKSGVYSYLELCKKTWEKFNRDYEIVVLDNSNLHEFIDINFYGQVLFSGKYSLPQIADAIRAYILYEYGGIWLDLDTIVLNDVFFKKLDIFDSEYDCLFFGNEVQRTTNICCISAKKHSKLMNLWRNEARKKIIQNKPQNEITWDFLGNSIINSYIKHNNDVCILDNLSFKTFAEMKFGYGVEPYRKFYFESNFCKSDLSQDTFVLFLHNSWTPLYYKNLNNYLFFLSNCTLSNILFETLGYKEILPLIDGLRKIINLPNYHNKKNQEMELPTVKNIDVLGCCISRDVFNHSFISEYKKFFNLKTYFPRCPIPCFLTEGMWNASVLSEKYALNAWQYEVFYKYLSKGVFEYLQSNQSDALIIDFYEDAIRGCVKIGEKFFPNIKPFTKILAAEGIKYKEVSYSTVENYFDLWCTYFDTFITNIKEMLPNTNIYINTVKGSYLLNSGDVVFDKSKVESVNELWAKMDNYALSKHNLISINFEKQYAIDPNYPYGGSNEIVHFEKAYYRDLFDKLKFLITKSEQKYSHVNLIKNHNFIGGLLSFWNFYNSKFETKLIGNQYFCTLSHSESYSNLQWFWIWNDPIEIFGNSKDAYVLSCDYIYLEKPKSLPKSILAVREFLHAIHKLPKDNVINYMLAPDEANVESNKVYHLSKVIVPRGKWLRVGIHLSSDNTKIAVSNIRLERVI